MTRPVSTAWSALGLAGSLLTALAAPRALHDGVVGWWYSPGLPAATALVWVGMIAFAVAWLGIARSVADGELTARRAGVTALVWLTPLLLAPPLFSRDVYSYLAQGTLLHLGRDPYTQAPALLATLHHGHTLAAVSPFWRHTTAPYGPLFLELVAVIVGVCGQHLIAGVLLCRALDLIGLGLLVVHVPRLTRALGADPGRGVWLAAGCPLVAFGLIAPAHNDLLMAGLLAAGVSVALRGNPLLGVALCAVAGTIKVPALVGAVFIVVAWARTERDPRDRVRFVAAAAVIALAVIALVTVIAGVGVGWLSSAIFSTPAKVRLAITPSTAVGYTAARLIGDLGVTVSARGLEAATGLVTTALVALVGLGLLWRVRVPRLVAALGATLLLAAAGGPAAWPWYLCWGTVLLAAGPASQRSRALLVPLVLGAFLVKPDGILALPLGSAPAVLAVYALAAVVAWLRWGRARGERPAGPGPLGGADPPAPSGTSPPPAALSRT